MISTKLRNTKMRSVLARVITRVLMPIVKRGMKVRSYEVFDGVVIGHCQSKPAKDFIDLAREALELIKAWDSRRYRRVLRNIEYIVDMSGIDLETRHFCVQKACMINHKKYFATRDPVWNVRCLACALIYEATLGVLEAKRIPFYWKNKKQAVRLGQRELISFVTRIDPVWAAEYYETDFDE